MRLECEHESPSGPGLAHGIEGRLDLGRVMAVVVDERDATGAGRDIAHELEPATDALESGERALDRRVLDFELGCDSDRRERVPHVVQARQLERDLEWRTARANRHEARGSALALER